jgi:hypothetical protein
LRSHPNQVGNMGPAANPSVPSPPAEGGKVRKGGAPPVVNGESRKEGNAKGTATPTLTLPLPRGRGKIGTPVSRGKVRKGYPANPVSLPPRRGEG